MQPSPYTLMPVPQPPVAPPGPGPGSPAPLFVGVAATVLGALGLLLTATAGAIVAVLTYTGTSSTDPEGDSTAPGLFALVSILALIGLLLAVALVIGGRDAGRSAVVWLSAVTLPWVLLMAVFFAVVRFGDEFDERSRLSGLSGLAGAGLAVLGLLTGAILLGIRPGRRWLAHRVLSRAAARPDAGGLPAPLRMAGGRFTTAVLLIAIAGAGLLVTWPLSAAGADDPDVAWFVVIVAAILLVLVAGPLLIAGLGARRARAGRRGGAVIARVFSVLPLFLLTVFVMLGIALGAVGIMGGPGQKAAATLSAAPTLALSAMVTVAFLAAIGMVLAGLAALADPRTESYLRRR